MRKLIIFILAVFSTLNINAQIDSEDSVRTVILETINYFGRQKKQQDRLLDFYTANKTSTTEDILSKLPELSLVRRGNYGMEPVIRSFNGNQINLLLDGMRIHGACTDKMDPPSIYLEPVNLSSIEVKTNGSSLMEGSSIGGSINMKISDIELSPDKLWSGMVQTAFHSVSRSNVSSAAIQYSTAKFGIRGTGSFRKAENYKDGKGNTVLYSGYSKINYALHAKLRLNDDYFLKADFIGDEGHDIGYAALPMDVGYAKARIGALSLIKENPLSSWNEITAKLYSNAIEHYMDDSNRPGLTVRMDMPGKSNTTGFYIEGKNRINSQKQLQLKADISYTTLHASMTMYQQGQPDMYMLTWPDNSLLQSGISGQYSQMIDSITQFTINARTDNFSYRLTSEEGKNHLSVFGHTETSRNILLPSISVQVNRNLSAKIKTGISLMLTGRAPTASELYGFYLFNQFDGYDYIGNPNIKAEKGFSAEWNFSAQNKKWKFNFSAYGSRIYNYITGTINHTHSAMTIGAKGVKEHKNIPYANVWGGESSVIYSFNNSSQMISTIRNHFGKDSDKNPLPMMAPFKWATAYRKSFDKIWLQAEFELAASRLKVNQATGEQPTKGFQLVHVKSGYTINGNNFLWQINAGIENILNTYYREHLDWGNIPRQGRNYFLQLSLSSGK